MHLPFFQEFAMHEEMSWNNKNKVWRRMLKGEMYTRSPRQLAKEGFPVESFTRDGSRAAANAYWRLIEKQTGPPATPVQIELSKRLTYAKLAGRKKLAEDIKGMIEEDTKDELFHPDEPYISVKMKALQELFNRSGLKIVKDGEEVDVRALDASAEELSVLFNIKAIWKDRVARVEAATMSIGAMIDKYIAMTSPSSYHIQLLRLFGKSLGATNSTLFNEATWRMYKDHADMCDQRIVVDFLHWCYMRNWISFLPN
jgi:hypothetical protein